MKRKIVLKCLCFIFLVNHSNAYAQTSDRDFIAQKIRINFIPHPNTPPHEIIRIPVSRVLNTSGFVFGSSDENGMPVCARFLKHLLRPVGSGADDGQPLLQQLIANILRITNDSVVVNIYKDDQPLNAYAKAQYLNPNYSNTHVWPAAWRGDKSAGTRENPIPGTNHTGYIRFGENYASNNGITEMRRTFVHEMMHTQDFSDVREHVWGAFRYGTDGDHYGDELIPNMADAFGEGIANSMTYLYSTVTRNRVIRWFANNGECFIEKPPSSDPERLLANHLPPLNQWLYVQVSSTTPPGPGRVPNIPGAAGYRIYQLSELQSRFLMHNEQIIGMIGAEYALKVGRTKYFQAIRSGNASMFRVSTSAVARWFEALSNAAIPDGLTLNDIRRTSRAEMPYLFALALADYFTYYRSNSVADFRAMFENSLSADWVDLYWTAGKDIVRRAAPITLTGGRPPVLNVRQNIDAIAVALGVRTP